MLVKINKNATIAVNLVKKFPADLDDIRLSLLPPIPKAHHLIFEAILIQSKEQQ